MVVSVGKLLLVVGSFVVSTPVDAEIGAPEEDGVDAAVVASVAAGVV